MLKAVNIPRTILVVANCWAVAERNLQRYILKNCVNKGEEFITESFHACFKEALQDASNKQDIAHAFFEDLKDELPGVQELDLHRISSGIVAEATLHNKAAEKKTGGDLGLVVLRPALTYSWPIIRIDDYRRGLLCQAKLKKRDGKWRTLTKPQKRTLPARLSYLALLLYLYIDKERRCLAPFSWQLCNGMRIEDVESALRDNKFSALFAAKAVIQGLGLGGIGTDQTEIIDEVISPVGNQSITIRIWWKNCEHLPGSSVHISLKEAVKQQQRLVVRY